MMNMSKYMHLYFMTNFSKSKYYKEINLKRAYQSTHAKFIITHVEHVRKLVSCKATA